MWDRYHPDRMKILSVRLRFLSAFLIFLAAACGLQAKPINPALVLRGDQTKDQDDICIWIHPEDPALSTIIASDKAANKVFVYDLAGKVLQSVADGFMPGNIDLRYEFPLEGKRIDLVGFNDRKNGKVVLYRVDTASRQLSRVDDRAIQAPDNYGFCLYRSPKTGKFFGFTTSESGRIEQIEFFEHQGRISGRSVREFKLRSQTEGAVCDDETGQAYFGEEAKGIWTIDAEPEGGNQPSLIAAVGDPSGLAADVEGLAIYYAAGGEGYLLASSQGRNKFTVFERKPPHRPAGEFRLAGVGSTDGIEVTSVRLNDALGRGIFVAHNGERRPYPAVVAKWEAIAAATGSGLKVDAEYWRPRSAAKH